MDAENHPAAFAPAIAKIPAQIPATAFSAE